MEISYNCNFDNDNPESFVYDSFNEKTYWIVIVNYYGCNETPWKVFLEYIIVEIKKEPKEVSAKLLTICQESLVIDNKQ